MNGDLGAGGRIDGAWARPACAEAFCSVLAVAGGCVATSCRGRFPLSDGVEIAVNPAAERRCGGCSRALMEQSLRELASSFAVLSDRVLAGIAAAQRASEALIALWIAESAHVEPTSKAFLDEQEWLGTDGAQ